MRISWKTDREVYVSCHLVLSVIVTFYFLFVSLKNLLLESCEAFEMYFVSFSPLIWDIS